MASPSGDQLNNMVDHTDSAPSDQFLTIDDASRLMSISASDLRQGIACGLIPIRRDNQGDLRIHRVEVPEDLLEQINHCQVNPQLHVEILIDEVSTLREQLDNADIIRDQLESLLARQSNALDKSARLLDTREAESAKLITLLDRSMRLLNHSQQPQTSNGHSSAESAHDSETSLSSNNAELVKSRRDNEKLATLLQRAFTAIEKSERISNERITRLTSTTDNAMQLLERAVQESESAKTDVNRLNTMVENSTKSSARIEQEIDQRDGVIDKQHDLMQRLVTLSEQTAAQAVPQQKRRRRTFWQWLWGGGKGI